MSFLLINWQATELDDKLPLIWPHPYYSYAYGYKCSNIYGKTRTLEFCSSILVEQIRKWVYGTYSEIIPLSYYFLSKPGVLWKLMERKHLKKHAFFSIFWPKMRVLVLNLGLFNSPEISISNKLHCRVIWLNIKCVECEKVGKMWSRIVKVVLSYPYPSRFRNMRHIYIGPTPWLAS